MSDKRYEANIIRATAVEPANNLESTSAPGVWSIDEVVELQKKSKWPTVGNVVTNVDSLFSTFLYEGTGANIAIDNGIDLSGEGGLVWYRRRDGAENNSIEDTVRGLDKVIYTDSSNAQADPGAYGLQAFNSNGFTAGLNTNGGDYVSWTFRKQAKFFDIVTYTGSNDGTNGQTISHNLGSVPGMILIKNLSNADAWRVFHRSEGATKVGFLNLTNAFAASQTPFANTAPTSTQFTLGTDSGSNYIGHSYVAYLFAHNNNDGGFGPDQDGDIIKCGSFTSDSSGIATVDLGFEPQWVLFKGTHAGSSWFLIDVMRGMTNGSNDAWLAANLTNAEGTTNTVITPTPTGFVTDGTNIVDPSSTFIYMAIRRPQAVPTAASDVFAVDFDDGATAPAYVSGFVTDMGIQTNTAGYNKRISTRLTSGKYLETDNTGAEQASTSNYTWDFMNGWNNQSVGTTWFSWMWKRARGYFDVVCYTGTGSARTVSHNLGVEPEMIWVKTRSNDVGWAVYHSSQGFSKGGRLETTDAFGTETNRVTGASSTTFTVGTDAYVNVSARTYIAYLFATLAGISKVGSVVHSGSSTDVDCGFSSGARLVILKRTDATGDWYIWDSVRGIVSGNDPYLLLNTTAAEVTNTDYIDPLSSGFQISGDFTDGTYIFYAIA